MSEFKPSMLGQAKNLGIRAAGAIGDYVAPQDFKSMTGSNDLVTNLKNVGSNIGRVGAATAINPGTAIVAAELNQATIDQYNASLMGNGMKDRGSRRNAIYEIYMNTGAYEADEVNSMLDKYGYAEGGLTSIRKNFRYGGRGSESPSIQDYTIGLEELIKGKVPKEILEIDDNTQIVESIDENGNRVIKVVDENEDFLSNLTNAKEGIEMAYGTSFNETEPQPMMNMRFKKGGKVIPIMPNSMSWKGKAKDYPGIKEIIKQNRKKKTGPGVQKKAEGGIMDTTTVELIQKIREGNSTPEIFEELMLRDVKGVGEMKAPKMLGGKKIKSTGKIYSANQDLLDKYNSKDRSVIESFLYDLRRNEPKIDDSNFYPEMAEGGIMDKNLLKTGMDKDMRVGGFIPEGTKEKADDVPARLSKNEFVMTADAVRAAGGGSVNQGAKRMYQLMNNLQGKA